MSKVPTWLRVYPEVTRWTENGQRFRRGEWVKARMDEANFIFVGDVYLVQQWMEYVIGLPSVIEYGGRSEAIAA